MYVSKCYMFVLCVYVCSGHVGDVLYMAVFSVCG